METPRLVGVGVHTHRGKYGAQMRKGQVRGKLGRNIMALCIMSKCGGNVVVSERKGRGCGEGHYGFMHNVEVWRWVKKEGGESGGEVSAGGGWVKTLWHYA